MTGGLEGVQETEDRASKAFLYGAADEQTHDCDLSFGNREDPFRFAEQVSPDRMDADDPWFGHIPFALWLVAALKPRLIVELGTDLGASYCNFCLAGKLCGTGLKCLSLNPWEDGGPFGATGDMRYAEMESHSAARYAEVGTLLRIRPKDGLTRFTDGAIDLFHIDGLRTCEAAQDCFESWLPKLAPGAVVLIHDTRVRGEGWSLWRFWQVLTTRYVENLEFPHARGLGVLQLPGGKRPAHLEFLRGSAYNKKTLIKYFMSRAAVLGEAREQRRLKTELARMARSAAVLSRSVSELDRQTGCLQDTVGNLERQLCTLSSEAAIREGAIVRSLSWRITRPLRAAAGLLRGEPAYLQAWGDSLRRLGGARLRFRKADASVTVGATEETALGQPSSAPATRVHDYREWLQRYETCDSDVPDQQPVCGMGLGTPPAFSLFTSVTGQSPTGLDSLIWSVRRQSYDRWELCVTDDGSADHRVREALESHVAVDGRIKVVRYTAGGGVSGAWNLAFRVAVGDYIGVLDRDILLAEHGLYWLARAILENPDAGLIFADEDTIDEHGRRRDPHFKCDLNIELLLAQDMISRSCVYRRSLVETSGGFRADFGGAQGYDLALRVIEHGTSKIVCHIPRVLYHQRVVPGDSVAADGESEMVRTLTRRAVVEHLRRQGMSADVVPSPDAPGCHRVRFELPNPRPLVSVIVPTRDLVDLLAKCVNSLFNLTAYPRWELVIVDNGSVEPATLAFLSTLPKDRVRVLRDESPFNFSALNNRAAGISRGKFLCFLNNDVEVLSHDWMDELVSFASQPAIGCVGARLWYPDGRLQHGGVILGQCGIAGHAHRFLAAGDPGYCARAVLHQSFCAVTAAALMVRRIVFEEVGGFDEALAVAFNDVDFCLRVQSAGYRNVWTPYAELIHHESLSRGKEDNPQKLGRLMNESRIMQERWGGYLLNDPYYSPNLTLDREDFSLAWPPRLSISNGCVPGHD